MEYTARTAQGRLALSDSADELYWILDGLASADDFVVFEHASSVNAFIQTYRRADGSLVVEYNDGTGLAEVADVDVLAAHQALLACLQGGPELAPRLRAVRGTFGSYGVLSPVDYEGTGLSIANAMLDAGKRRRWLGRPGTIPPLLSWGARQITSGDVWRDVPVGGSIAVAVRAFVDGLDHGFAVSAQGGALSHGGLADGSESAEELVLWPTPTEREFEVRYTSPRQILLLCNVYRVSGPTWSKVDKWSENAGLWIEQGSERVRTYHCNHASTRPPTFADLVVTVSVDG